MTFTAKIWPWLEALRTNPKEPLPNSSPKLLYHSPADTGPGTLDDTELIISLSEGWRGHEGKGKLRTGSVLGGTGWLEAALREAAPLEAALLEAAPLEAAPPGCTTVSLLRSSLPGLSSADGGHEGKPMVEYFKPEASNDLRIHM